MKAIRLHRIIEKDGEITITGLPLKKGEEVEIILLLEPSKKEKPYMTTKQLLDSELIGLWQDREDITDSATFARKLRVQAQRRR